MSELDFKSTELVLFIGGALLTVAVFVIAVLLYRMASREQREQEKKERGE
jgi:preprotein translocase subunit YajC